MIGFDKILEELAIEVAKKFCAEKHLVGNYRLLDKLTPFPLVFDDEKVVYATEDQIVAINDREYKKLKELVDKGYELKDIVADLNFIKKLFTNI